MLGRCAGDKRPMPSKFSTQVRECREYAAEARAKAEATRDPALSLELLEMERRWLVLARGFAFTESLEDFTKANADWRRASDELLAAASEPERELFDTVARLQ